MNFYEIRNREKPELVTNTVNNIMTANNQETTINSAALTAERHSTDKPTGYKTQPSKTVANRPVPNPPS
jgi:hypothetical protein